MVAVGTAHHLMQRAAAHRTVFETDSDCLVYLSLLRQYSRLDGLRILAYCLMPDHVHLVAVPERADSMARALSKAHGLYSAYLNTRQCRAGPLWQARYYSCPLDAAHVWVALRYVERNPVRASLAAQPAAYPWSSAAVHCGDSAADALLDLPLFRRCWNGLFWSRFLACDEADGGEAFEIWHATRAGRPLGCPEFVKALERMLDRPLLPLHRERLRRCLFAQSAATLL